MLDILLIIIMFILLFDGHTIRKQNTQLLEQNDEIVKRLVHLQEQAKG